MSCRSLTAAGSGSSRTAPCPARPRRRRPALARIDQLIRFQPRHRFPHHHRETSNRSASSFSEGSLAPGANSTGPDRCGKLASDLVGQARARVTDAINGHVDRLSYK